MIGQIGFKRYNFCEKFECKIFEFTFVCNIYEAHNVLSINNHVHIYIFTKQITFIKFVNISSLENYGNIPFFKVLILNDISKTFPTI